MQYKIVPVLAALVAIVAADPHVDTPASLLTCQPAKLSWTGDGPFFVSILPGGQASAAPLENLGQQTGETLVWTPDLAAGTSITISVTDSTGAVAYSSAVTIGAGSSTSCVGTGSTAATSAAAAAGTDATSSAAATGRSRAGAAAGSATSAAGAATSAAASKAASAPAKNASAAPAAASPSVSTDESSGAVAIKMGAAVVFGSLVASLLLV